MSGTIQNQSLTGVGAMNLQLPSTNTLHVMTMAGLLTPGELSAFLQAKDRPALLDAVESKPPLPQVKSDGQPKQWSAAPSTEALQAGKGAIRFGQQGAAVTEQQKRLEALGFTERIFGADGKHGVKSRENVRSFQAKNGLPESGEFDAATMKKMGELEAKPAQSAPRRVETGDVARLSSQKDQLTARKEEIEKAKADPRTSTERSRYFDQQLGAINGQLSSVGGQINEAQRTAPKIVEKPAAVEENKAVKLQLARSAAQREQLAARKVEIEKARRDPRISADRARVFEQEIGRIDAQLTGLREQIKT